MRKLQRRIVRGALVFVGVVIAAAGAAVIALHTDWGREQVRVRLEDRLGDVFVGGGTVGKLEGSPFGELVARDVVIRDPGGAPAITVKTLRIRLAILPLISKEARLSTVIADDAEVKLARDERGELSIAHLLKPGPKSGWSADLPDIRLHRAHVAYDPGRGEPVNLDGIELAAEAHAPFGQSLGAAVKLTAHWRERGLPIELDASVRSGDDGLTLRRMFARAGDIVVTGDDVWIGKSPAGGPAFSGAISVVAPRAAVERLGLGFDTPADLSVRVTAERLPASPWTRVDLAGSIGGEPVTARLRADLDARRFAGFVSTGTLDATTLSDGRIEGSAAAFVTFDAALPADRELPVGSAMIHAWGTIEGVPETAARIALTSTGERASAIVELEGRALHAAAAAELSKRGEAITLHRGTLTASTGDPQSASGGAAPVHGAFHAELTASGALAPRPELAVAGTIDGRRLRFRDLSIDSMKLAIDARQLPARPRGRVELAARGVVRGTMNLIELAVTAADRPDGKLAVAVRTRPRQHPWLIEADALVTPGDTVGVELLRHHVRTGNGADWRGTSGRVALSPERLEVRDLATRSAAGGAIELDGVFHRAGRRAGDVEARVEVRSLALDNLDTRYRGAASGRVELARRAGRVTAHAELAGRGLALDAAAAPVDADAKLDVREGQLVLDARASSPRLGRVAVAADLAAPRDASDLRAWQALGRSAIRSGRVTLDRIDVARVAALAGREGEHRGVINGELRLSGTASEGAVTVRGLVTPATRGLGAIDADLQLAQTPRGQLAQTPRWELAPALTVRLADLGSIDARAVIVPPARPFDPAAWRRLGRGAIAGAEVRTSELAFDPGVLDRFGVITNLRGRASLAIELGAGARTAKVSARVRELRGSPIADPVSVDLTAAAGEEATTIRLIAGTAAARLVEVDGRIARSFVQLQASPRTAPLKVTVKLPAAPARQLFAVLGRTEVVSGTLSGTIDIAGTAAAPTARAQLTATDIALPSAGVGRQSKPLERLVIDASWNGREGSLALSGTEPGGQLRVLAKGSPGDLGHATLSLRATRFDLRPVLVFVPGAVGASGGVLDANLVVTGLDPRTARAAGELHLADARVPLAPTIGTLRRAKIDVIAGERDFRLAVDGRLGSGTVKAAGTFAMVGAAPTGGDVTLELRKVSPIGAMEPEIDADVKAKLTKAQGRWIADVTVSNGEVRVPKGHGQELKPVGPPPDLVFVSGGSAGRRERAEAPPARPVIEARVVIGPTYLVSEELRGIIRGKVTVTADAESIGIVGAIEAYRGDLDLFGRRYLVERAAARFDGPPDPLLDIVITHDFPEVTTITSVRGRLSKPELIMSSEPSIYSQGQLLGFLLGGEPNGEPATGNPRDRVAAAGTSLVANRLGGYVKRALPFDIDVLKYEAATASSSAAFTVGTWLTRSLFVSYRRRFEARTDENTGEAEAEYWMTRRVMLEGVLGDRGYSGVDLLWRKRY